MVKIDKKMIAIVGSLKEGVDNYLCHGDSILIGGSVCNYCDHPTGFGIKAYLRFMVRSVHKQGRRTVRMISYTYFW